MATLAGKIRSSDNKVKLTALEQVRNLWLTKSPEVEDPEICEALGSALRSFVDEGSDVETIKLITNFVAWTGSSLKAREYLCQSSFISAVQRGLKSDQVLAPVKKELLRFLGNSSSTFSTHKNLLPLVATAIAIFPHVPPFCKGGVVTFINLLAYNEDSREQLRQYGVLDALIVSLRSNDQEMWPTDAALAIANLYGHEESNPALDAGQGTSVMTMLKDCLSQTLQGLSYPPNSNSFYTDWKLTMGIGNFCKSDANKAALQKADIVPLLISALVKQKDDTRLAHQALKALWHITFVEGAQKQVRESTAAVAKLQSMLQSSAIEADDAKAAKGILWNLGLREPEPKPAESETAAGKPEAKPKEQPKYVMLSYCWANQPVVLEINKALKANGFATWIDVDAMTGSTLEAMAGAVEGCEVFVCTLSSSYKQSAACRLEGEYAFSKRKRIVPIMVETNYNPDGWLGALVGSKLWIDFSNPQNMQSACDRLVRELCNAMQASGGATAAPSMGSSVVAAPSPALYTHTPPPNAQKIAALASMSSADITKWLGECGLEDCSRSLAALNVDGRVLVSAFNFSHGTTERDMKAWVEVWGSMGVAPPQALVLRFELKKFVTA
eukprot:c5797_g1_i2.p1 GENE.c5797_g1_i2~~c5797_g1_i2.p1  ORF type:complete len:640 (+),score=209.27 c5797_g1_i2:85-1920(+)